MFGAEALSDVVGIFIAGLYTLADQAHFTSRLTPGLAANIEIMTPNSHRAFWFLGLEYLTVCNVLMMRQ